MLSWKIRTRLCQSCRNDLFNLFVNGSGPTSKSRVRPLRNHQRYSPHSASTDVATCAFSTKHGLWISTEGPKEPLEQSSSNADVSAQICHADVSAQICHADVSAQICHADVSAQIYHAELESTKQLPNIPTVGDNNEPGSQYIAESVDGIANRSWEVEKAGAGLSSQATAHASQSLHEDWGPRRQAVVEPGDRDRGGVIEYEGLDVAESHGLVVGSCEFPYHDNEHTAEPGYSVELKRDSNASVEEVVREARQLHGEFLPDGVLSEDESKTYRRLYGEPLTSVANWVERPEAELDKQSQELLDHDGETIAYEENKPDRYPGQAKSSPDRDTVHLDQMKSNEEQRAMEVAELVGGKIRPVEDPQAMEEAGAQRDHPLTVVGRFQTSPRTVYLPQQALVQPVQKILSEYSNKHVKEMCERLFGGPGLPNSPLTPRISRTMPQTSIPVDASQNGMGTMEANAFVSAVWPSTYAAVISVLVETRKRLGSQWLRDLLSKDGGASVLDAGGGGVGILAWREIIGAEWEALHSSDASPPPTPRGKSTVVTGADNLRYRAASLLENTTFLPRLPDYVHVRGGATLSDDRAAAQRKQFDVIIAPHTLWSLAEDWQRKQQVQNLWSMLNPEGGIVILIEKGVPRGFEVIAGARELLLSRYIATADSPTYESKLESSNEDGTVRKGKGLIIAPCTNHAPCPMYPVPGVSRGRKDYCAVQQRYIRPPFLQHILGATDRNHDDVDFSYVAVQRGRDLQDTVAIGKMVSQGKGATDSAFEGYEDAAKPEETAQVSPLTLPRLVYPPLKRHGHVTMDVCTPAGKIDRWTVSKSFSKAAYRDARKASRGDLWALGAKTRVARNLQLGGGKSKAGNQNKRMMDKARGIVDRMKEEKREDRELRAEMERAADEEEDAILGADDIDVDAEEVLREIEREKWQARGETSGVTEQVGQTRAPATYQQRHGGSPSQRGRGKKAAQALNDHILTTKRCAEKNPSSYLNPSHKSSSVVPHHNSILTTTTTTTTTTSSNPSRPRNPLDNMDPQERADLEAFAAESRADRQSLLSLQRLSGHAGSTSAKLRIRRGENKFGQPEREKWRAEMEEAMARRKEKKLARNERGEKMGRRRD